MEIGKLKKFTKDNEILTIIYLTSSNSQSTYTAHNLQLYYKPLIKYRITLLLG
jgi:hypothetical protein